MTASNTNVSCILVSKQALQLSCFSLMLDLKQLGFCLTLLFLQTWLTNKMLNMLWLEKKTVILWREYFQLIRINWLVTFLHQGNISRRANQSAKTDISKQDISAGHPQILCLLLYIVWSDATLLNQTSRLGRTYWRGKSLIPKCYIILVIGRWGGAQAWHCFGCIHCLPFWPTHLFNIQNAWRTPDSSIFKKKQFFPGHSTVQLYSHFSYQPS